MSNEKEKEKQYRTCLYNACDTGVSPVTLETDEDDEEGIAHESLKANDTAAREPLVDQLAHENAFRQDAKNCASNETKATKKKKRLAVAEKRSLWPSSPMTGSWS